MFHLALFINVFSVEKSSLLQVQNALMLKCLHINSRCHCSSCWTLDGLDLYKKQALLLLLDISKSFLSSLWLFKVHDGYLS